MWVSRVAVFALVLVFTRHGDSANILGLFPFAAGSHQVIGTKLMMGLAEAGHNVTVFSTTPLKNPPKYWKYKNILLEGLVEIYKGHMGEFNPFIKNKIEHNRFKMVRTFDKLANATLNYPALKQLVESGQHFDAFIMEEFFLDSLKVYAHLFDCPLILISALGQSGHTNALVGNPTSIAYLPEMFNSRMINDLSFTNRLLNLFAYSSMAVFRQYRLPGQDKVLKEVYPNAPTTRDMLTNVSLLLLNSHSSFNPAGPYVPNMVEIGGYFIDPPKSLPQHLQTFIDSAPDGVIYFSMGSNLKSKDMIESKRKIFLNVFRRLKQKVIWKFEEKLEGKPDNVLIQKWCPQQDILAHPNIKLFITHGGLLSTIETVYNGVPILALPIFADQPSNAARAEASGYALKLDYFSEEFSEDQLESRIKELLNNPKYMENVKDRSKVYHDRPMKPMDSAIYWIEYVIRHKGAQHLRVAGLNLPLYKYLMLDVFAVIFGVLTGIVYVIKLLFKKCISRKVKID